MPTILPSAQNLSVGQQPLQSNAKQGPQVVLSVDAAKTPVSVPTPVQPGVSPATPPVVSTTPVVKAAPVVENSESIDAFEKQEVKLTAELQKLNEEQAKLLKEMKELVEESGTAEAKETELQAKIQDLHTKRNKLQHNLTAPIPEPVAMVTPVESPAAKPIPPATPTTPPIESQTEQAATVVPAEQVISTLNAKYGHLNPMIGTTLVAGAQVYTTPKQGILIEHEGNTVHFSAMDVEQAGLQASQLTTLPQKTSSNMPEPATGAVPKPAVVPVPGIAPVAPVTPTEAAPVQVPPVQVVPITGTPASPQLISKLQQLTRSDIQAVLIANPQAVRSANDNGIMLMANGQSVLVSDAELIQTGIGADDLAGLTQAPAEPVAVQQ